MSHKYKFHNPGGVYFVSFAVQAWVDVFTRNEYKNILIENLAYCQYQFKTPDGYRFWNSGNHPIELWSNGVIDQKLEYIHQNPVEEGLVYKAEHYMYSSAADYAGEKGMLDIILIE